MLCKQIYLLPFSSLTGQCRSRYLLQRQRLAGDCRQKLSGENSGGGRKGENCPKYTIGKRGHTHGGWEGRFCCTIVFHFCVNSLVHFSWICVSSNVNQIRHLNFKHTVFDSSCGDWSFFTDIWKAEKHVATVDMQAINIPAKREWKSKTCVPLHDATKTATFKLMGCYAFTYLVEHKWLKAKTALWISGILHS